MSEKDALSDVLAKNNFDYESIRKKLINAKTSVLAFDCLFTAGTMGSVGFINRHITRKKTGRDGFSAEFNMGDKELIENRAKKFKETEKLRNNIFIGALLLLTASPLLIKKGLNSKGKFADFIKKHADKFDYNDGIFMKRLPFFLMTCVSSLGIIMSSRNYTEIKDNVIRASASQITYFGGDIVIGSALAALSDKLFKTELLDKNCKKSFINKIIPPIKHIKELQGKNKKIAAGFFWVNMIALFAAIGIGVPRFVNKMIKNDVKKDVSNSLQGKNVIKTEKYPDVYSNFKINS